MLRFLRSMNIHAETKEYIDSHPSIKNSLPLINYSKLSRRIVRDLSLTQGQFDAVLVAVRRYANSAVLDSNASVVGVLRKSNFSALTNIAVVVIDRSIYSDDLIEIEKKIKRNRDLFYTIEGSASITVILPQRHLTLIQERFKHRIVKLWQNLALITISSPANLQDETPGFLAVIASRLSENNVNILEFMSCWSETLLVVEEQDVGKALELLRQNP